MDTRARVRPAAPTDARPIAQVHVASWRWAYSRQLPEAALQALSVDDRQSAWTAWFADPEPGSGAIVAELDERVVGFTGFGPSRDDDADPGTAEIRTIYLLEEVAGLGIGRELFEAAADALRDLGYRRATLWVLDTNERARRFYEIAGWKADGATSTEHVECSNLPTVRYSVDLA